MSGRYIIFQDSACNLPNDSQVVVPIDPGCPNASEHGTRVGSEDDPTVKFLRYFSEIWISFPLVLFGIVGNTLSLIILLKHRQRQKLRTILILLRTLAVFDTFVLLTVLLLRTLRYIGPSWYVVFHTLTYPFLYPTAHVLRLINTWITVLLTMDRYLAVCRPLHAQSLCTVSKTYLQIAAVVAFSILFSMPRYFEYYIEYYPDKHYGMKTTALVNNHLYMLMYRIILTIQVHYILPTIALVWLNSLVIRALRKSDAYRCSHQRRVQRFSVAGGASVCGHQAPVNPAVFQSTRSVTVVVIVVVCICIGCHVVTIIAQLSYALQNAFEQPVIQSTSFELFRRHVSQASNVLVTFNSAVNFVVYCLCSRTFRAVLVAQFFSFLPRNGHFRRRCYCCCCWCCGVAPVDATLLHQNGPPPICHQSSTNTNNSTRSMTNSIMLSLMSGKISKKKDSLRDDIPDTCATWGPSQNQGVNRASGSHEARQSL